jgi:hypothetical protein
MTPEERKVMELALEALELAQDNLRDHGDNCFLHDEGEYNRCFCGKDSLSDHLQSVVEKLDEALAQLEQEPVAVVTGVYGGRFIVEPTNSAMVLPVNMALYAHPPHRKPLTREQIVKCQEEASDEWCGVEELFVLYARAIEAAHGIKE